MVLAMTADDQHLLDLVDNTDEMQGPESWLDAYVGLAEMQNSFGGAPAHAFAVHERRTLLRRIHDDRRSRERRTLLRRKHGDRHRAAHVKDACFCGAYTATERERRTLLRRIHGDRHRAAHVKGVSASAAHSRTQRWRTRLQRRTKRQPRWRRTRARFGGANMVTHDQT